MSTRNALKTATREAWLSEYCRPYNAHLDRELAAGRLTLAQVEQGRAAKRADGLRRWRKLRRFAGPDWRGAVASIYQGQP